MTLIAGVHNPTHHRIPPNWRPSNPDLRLVYFDNCKRVGKDYTATPAPRQPPAPSRNAGVASYSNNRGGERGNRKGGGLTASAVIMAEDSAILTPTRGGCATAERLQSLI